MPGRFFTSSLKTYIFNLKIGISSLKTYIFNLKIGISSLEIYIFRLEIQILSRKATFPSHSPAVPQSLRPTEAHSPLPATEKQEMQDFRQKNREKVLAIQIYPYICNRIETNRNNPAIKQQIIQRYVTYNGKYILLVAPLATSKVVRETSRVYMLPSK